MSVLVTGAGLVGSWVARELHDQGELPILLDVQPHPELIDDVVDLNKVPLVQGDVLDLAALLKIIQEYDVKHVVHTAALLSGYKGSPLDVIGVNIMGLANVLEASRLMRLRRVVYTSSMGVYASAAANLTMAHEDFEMLYLRDRPRHLYTTTKVAAEYVGLSFQDMYGVEFVSIRLAGIIGPSRLPMTGGIGRLIDNMIRQLLRGERVAMVDVWNEGKDIFYIRDAARGTVLACLAENLKTGAYNVGIGKLCRLQDIAAILRDLIPGAQIDILPTETNTGEKTPAMKTLAMDISLAWQELGFVAEYDLRKALTDYVQWLRAEGAHRGEIKPV